MQWAQEPWFKGQVTKETLRIMSEERSPKSSKTGNSTLMIRERSSPGRSVGRAGEVCMRDREYPRRTEKKIGKKTV